MAMEQRKGDGEGAVAEEGKLCQPQRMGDGPKATRELFCCSSRHRRDPEGNVLLLWIWYGVFFLVMLNQSYSACTTSEKAIRVIAAGGAARTAQAFPWEKASTKPLV